MEEEKEKEKVRGVERVREKHLGNARGLRTGMVKEIR